MSDETLIKYLAGVAILIYIILLIIPEPVCPGRSEPIQLSSGQTICAIVVK